MAGKKGQKKRFWSEDEKRSICAQSFAPTGTGGHPPRKIVGEIKAWLLERIKAPSTLRVLVSELADWPDPTVLRHKPKQQSWS